MKYLIWAGCLFSLVNLSAQNELTPQLILEKSIAFHDPDNKLFSNDYSFHFEESRPDGTIRKTKTRMAPSKERFDIISVRDNQEIKYQIRREETKISVDGSSDISDENRKKYRLTENRAVMMKNYYHYLWHLPMKLNDPGTIISDNYSTKTFNNYDCYEIKVTYDENVGHDTWYFYFDTSDFQLRGYRFYHDETKNDGEYILIDGLTTFKNIKIPSQRDWYTHKEDKFLGSDKLIKISKH